ncbi:MAG: acyl-CoA dehydrogenase family protein [Deltaproteobacteria bacterium]|nr:acyl-CoA dehydrogenase family protein [Deltaproteobacteria bacterium]
MAMQFFREEHEIFRRSLRSFLEREVKPHLDEWGKNRQVPRDIWRKLGDQGFIGYWVDEKYGGTGADFLYSVVLIGEMVRAGALGLAAGVGVHNDIVMPYIDILGTEEQKMHWLPKCCTGEYIAAIGMTEPGAGSDLQAIRATAVRDGDDYVINGQKTFITNGYSCDLIVLAVKTDPRAQPPYKGISLIVVEEGTPGFIKSRKLEKMGLHASDTAELFFEDCRVPAGNLLGQEGDGFVAMMRNLQQERLVSTLRNVLTAERMLEITIEYCQTRTVFGKPVSKHQHNAFKIVEMATEIEMAKDFTFHLVSDHLGKKDITKKVSMAKWYNAELANRVAYQCVQLHGGYGYMSEYEICRYALDVRMGSIAAGTTEVMKTIIARGMGL